MNYYLCHDVAAALPSVMIGNYTSPGIEALLLMVAAVVHRIFRSQFHRQNNVVAEEIN